MKDLIEKSLEKSISYDEYRTKVEDLVKQGKTSGPNQSEELSHHTKMGLQRMKKWEKITPNTISLERNLHRCQRKNIL